MTLGRRNLLPLATAAAIVGVELARRDAAAAEPVRLICGFGAGNPTDLCAELIQDGMSATRETLAV